MSTKNISADLKLDKELTAMTVKYIESCEEVYNCPDCGHRRYMSAGFFCMNEECTTYKKETGKL